MKKIFRKLFINGEWHIAYKPMESFCLNEICNDVIEYESINNTNEYWYADPLLYEYDCKKYLFVEAYSKKHRKGEIGVFQFDGVDDWKYSHLISEPFHMSFPYVFEYKGNHYMIPETCEIRQMILYKASRFPYEWKKEKVLLDDKAVVDTAVLRINENNKYRVITYDKERKQLLSYILSEDMELTDKCIIDDINSEKRGAGRILDYEGDCIRPSQLCYAEYGEKVIFNKIIDKENEYSEEKINVLTSRNCDIKGKNIAKIHTFSELDNMMVIDYYTEYFDILRIPKIILNRLERKKRKKQRSNCSNEI